METARSKTNDVAYFDGNSSVLRLQSDSQWQFIEGSDVLRVMFGNLLRKKNKRNKRNGRFEVARNLNK